MNKPLRNVAKFLICRRKFHSFYINIRKSIPLTFFWIDVSLFWIDMTEVSEYFEYSSVLQTISRGKKKRVSLFFVFLGIPPLRQVPRGHCKS